jgi:hypothetical protein
MIIRELQSGCPEEVFSISTLRDIETEDDYRSYPTINLRCDEDKFSLSGNSPDWYGGINPNTAEEFLSYFNINIKPQPVRWENNKIIMNFI